MSKWPDSVWRQLVDLKQKATNRRLKQERKRL